MAHPANAIHRISADTTKLNYKEVSVNWKPGSGDFEHKIYVWTTDQHCPLHLSNSGIPKNVNPAVNTVSPI